MQRFHFESEGDLVSVGRVKLPTRATKQGAKVEMTPTCSKRFRRTVDGGRAARFFGLFGRDAAVLEGGHASERVSNNDKDGASLDRVTRCPFAAEQGGGVIPAKT